MKSGFPNHSSIFIVKEETTCFAGSLQVSQKYCVVVSKRYSCPANVKKKQKKKKSTVLVDLGYLQKGTLCSKGLISESTELLCSENQMSGYLKILSLVSKVRPCIQ